jgi:Copper type II ascorbate-dependent monooxygenase, C-terminal domain
MIRRITAVLPILLALLAAFVFEACSGGNSTPSAPDPSAGLQYSLSIGPIMAMPGEENTQCIIVHLGNMSSIHVGAIHNVLTDGSHHMIVYRSSETVEQTTPVNCVPFTDTLDPTKGSTLVVSQKKDDTLTLPQGVAFTLDPAQMIRIELHYINTGSTPLEITGTTNFVTMANSQYKDEAGFLFIGDPDITLPPHATTTLGPVFFSMPAQYQGVNFFAITGHEHQMGTGVTVSTAASSTDPGTSVYDVPGWLWSEPATVVAAPPFVLPAQGGFTFTCNWDNTSDQTIKFGESALDEMCFFWAYYYPSQGSQVCIHSDKVGNGGVDVCCPGASFVCSEIIDYLNSDGGGSFGSFGGGGGGSPVDSGASTDSSVSVDAGASGD